MSAAVALTACSLTSEPFTPSENGAMPPGREALTRFYEQKLVWSDCEGGQCSDLEVPLDYATPDGETIRIAVFRAPARKAGSRRGSLVVNPGGPGASGVDYARAADYIVTPQIRNVYDVVGFDPRGVARSAPIDCVSDRGLDRFLGQDPTPDDTAEQREFAATSKAFATECGRTAGPLLGHVSTREAAQDMDVLRAALGDDQLTYLGKSYGTFLGATYAEEFPEQAGRLVLDGAVAPDLTSEQFAIGQGQGFDRATRQWAADCADSGECPWNGDADNVVAGLKTLLTRLDETPLPLSDGRPDLTEGWASLGVAQAMYDQGMWAALTQALRDVQNGDGAALMDLADQYAERNADGTYSGNIMEAIYAVNCLDSAESASLDHYRKMEPAVTKAAPIWGEFMVWGSMVCGFWPEKATGKAGPIAAKGAAPILVVGTTRDPATPYEWAQRLAGQLDQATLLTYDGDGHTAYMRSNNCVNDAVDRYWLEGTLPADGTRC